MIRPPEIFHPMLLALIVSCLLVGSGACEEGNAGARSGEGASPHRGVGGEKRLLESLNREERTRLREALRQVWTEPAVINAREEVKRAGEAYRSTIRRAIAEADPAAAKLLERVREDGGRKVRKRPGGDPRGKMGPRRGGDHPVFPPGLMERLTAEERKRVRMAEEAARETEPVRRAEEALRELRRRDDALRRERVRTHRRLRGALLEAMIEIDPAIADIRNRLDPRQRGEKGSSHGSRGDSPDPSEEESSPSGAAEEPDAE